jgi:hypothetical protein
MAVRLEPIACMKMAIWMVISSNTSKNMDEANSDRDKASPDKWEAGTIEAFSLTVHTL